MTSVSSEDNPPQQHLYVGEPVVSVVAGDKRLTWALFMQFSDRLWDTAWLLALSPAQSIILNGTGYKLNLFQKAIIISKLWMDKQRERLANILSVFLPTSRPRFSSVLCRYRASWPLCVTCTLGCLMPRLSGRLYIWWLIHGYKSHHYIVLLL